MNEPFSNLMERYSSEAQAAKAADDRRLNRAKLRAAIGKYVSLVVFLALVGATYYYRAPVRTTLDQFTAKMFPPKPVLTAGQQAKVSEVSQLQDTRNKQIDDTMK